NTGFVASFQVFLPAAESGLLRDSKIQAEQIRSVSVQRLGGYIGTVSAKVLWQVEHTLKLHLALPV
ncbi:MAG: type II toxin-antitoxin system PemK/MazF family toxin, partial [Rothia sp. (in: high G+C Gram-positive bacteria)]|nr:type II toxin-antitoxin system PemK/MazF family toxin [Rothia sp. (in: high G+C Gram-positive bacteria)]